MEKYGFKSRKTYNPIDFSMFKNYDKNLLLSLLIGIIDGSIQSNRKDSTTIRICRREILQLLQDVITNNNLFYLKRKWNKLMIKEPSASES